jgi:hypothetical protein
MYRAALRNRSTPTFSERLVEASRAELELRPNIEVKDHGRDMRD